MKKRNFIALLLCGLLVLALAGCSEEDENTDVKDLMGKYGEQIDGLKDQVEQGIGEMQKIVDEASGYVE